MTDPEYTPALDFDHIEDTIKARHGAAPDVSWQLFSAAAALLDRADLERRLWNALLACGTEPLSPTAPAPPPPRRRRLTTPKQVVHQIRDTIHALQGGQDDPATARTKLYALQTLLVAMRMAAEMTESTPKLQRGASNRALPAAPDQP